MCPEMDGDVMRFLIVLLLVNFIMPRKRTEMRELKWINWIGIQTDALPQFRNASSVRVTGGILLHWLHGQVGAFRQLGRVLDWVKVLLPEGRTHIRRHSLTGAVEIPGSRLDGTIHSNSRWLPSSRPERSLSAR